MTSPIISGPVMASPSKKYSKVFGWSAKERRDPFANVNIEHMKTSSMEDLGGNKNFMPCFEQHDRSSSS
jgi:hypothetical protein